MKKSDRKISKDEIEIIHRVNRLKKKVSTGGVAMGEGYIDPEAVRRAGKVISDTQDSYADEAGRCFADLCNAWSAAKSGDHKAVYDIGIYTNRIKDMASTYGYEIMAYFSKSLRDFSEKMDPILPAHLTIVQAHIDVMRIALKEKIKAEDEPRAEELKGVLLKAIEKHGDRN